jgi:serine protease Do
VEPITPALVNDYRLRINQGVVVTEVVRGSGAEQAQIQPGDVIVQLGGAPVATLTDLGTMVQLLPTSGAMPIRIVRGNLVGNVRLQF